MEQLIIVADDYGYAAAYDEGILEAARAGAVDVVSAMALRECEPGPLLESAVEVGLHLEAGTRVSAQLEAFGHAFGRPPTYLDGHHHCHAGHEMACEVVLAARRTGVPVRSVSAEHRQALRAAGVPTPDRLLGRLREDEPPMPGPIEAWLAGDAAPEGATEWMVHPGHPDSASGSSYDRGRAQDLELLLSLGDRPAWRRRGIERAGPSSLLTIARFGPP